MSNKIDYNSVKGELSIFMTDLADSNYYNPRLNVVRVASPIRDGEFVDFKLAPTWYPPNPKDHRILLMTSRESLSSFGLDKDQLKFPPGIQDKNQDRSTIRMGIAYIIDRNQRLYTVDNQSGSAGFSIRNTNMSEDNRIKVALAPPLPKDYFNNDAQDQDSNQVGLFMTNDVVLLRSKGAQITLGDEGIHFGGKIHWESTTHSKEIMQDNFIHQLIPSTIPTAAISIPQLPNFGLIAQIAEIANKVIDTIGIATDVIKNVV